MNSYEFDAFEWDDRKSKATFDDRGLDFDTAALIFANPTLQRTDHRADYGETRYIATGSADGIIITVIWTQREKICRIIRAWPATRREERLYLEYCKKISE